MGPLNVIVTLSLGPDSPPDWPGTGLAHPPAIARISSTPREARSCLICEVRIVATLLLGYGWGLSGPVANSLTLILLQLRHEGGGQGANVLMAAGDPGSSGESANGGQRAAVLQPRDRLQAV